MYWSKINWIGTLLHGNERLQLIKMKEAKIKSRMLWKENPEIKRRSESINGTMMYVYGPYKKWKKEDVTRKIS